MVGRILLVLGVAALLASRAGAQEPEEPSPPRFEPANMAKLLEETEEALKLARSALEDFRRRRVELERAYAGGEDAPEQPSKYEALALMGRLEDRASTARHHEVLDPIRNDLELCVEAIDRTEEALAMVGDSDENLRRRRELEGYRRDLRTMQKRLNELLLVREGEHEEIRDTLFLLRRENILLRGRSELSWSNIGAGVRDLAGLPGWLADSAKAAGAYLGGESGRTAMLRLAGLAGVGLLAVFFLGRALGRRASRLRGAGEPTVRTRAMATAYLLLRDLVVAGLLFVLPYGASVTLPGLPAGVVGLLQEIGRIFGGLWLLRALLREILAPEARERTTLAIDPAAAARLWSTARILIGISLVMLPLLSALEHLGYANRGAREALWLAYKSVIGLFVLALMMRRSLLLDLVPEGPGLTVSFYRWAVRFLRPLAAVLVPVLLVLDALRFDLLVETVVRYSLALVTVVVLTAFLYRLLTGLAHARIHKIYPDSSGAENERRREAAEAGSAFVVFLVVAYSAVAGFLALSGTSSDGMRRLLDVPLPLMGRSGGQVVTWWNVLVALVILVIFAKGTRPAKLVLAEFVLARTKFDRGLQYTIVTLVGYVLLASGVLIAASHIVDLSTLGYIAAALSVGIGFGLQEIVSNFVSGLILLFERPLKVGDTVEVGGTRGVVKHISIRATTVRTLDNIVLLVPNREFITQSVINFSHSDPKLRLHVPVGVSYGSDTDLVKRLLAETGAAHPLVRKWPAPEVLFLDFGDSSLDFDLLVWINNPDDRNRVRSELRFAIFGAFAEHGVQIPFPQRDLHVRSADGLHPPVADGEPDKQG